MTPTINTGPLLKDAAQPLALGIPRDTQHTSNASPTQDRPRNQVEGLCQATLLNNSDLLCLSMSFTVVVNTFIFIWHTSFSLLYHIFPSCLPFFLLPFPFSLYHYHRSPCTGLWEGKESEKELAPLPLGIENWMEQVRVAYMNWPPNRCSHPLNRDPFRAGWSAGNRKA